MPNRLINEKSLYLRQHAHNPVDWYPWSEEAFEKAKKEDKPVFLSIGYSTCHWCHVMERESFEDREIADILNRYFVSIKVDREERPDVDSVYMNVCMMMTGRGGWPLTVFLTPDKKPFYAGTYFPKESSYTRIGLKDLLLNISKLWSKDREKLINRAQSIVKHLEDINKTTDKNKLPENIPVMLFEKLKDMFDPYNGGFGRKPKFPVPHNLLFLMRYYHKTKNKNATEMVNHTLEKMRLGGIYDHVGFGFHRYSTDERWFLPHFEKMLYDQAMLIMAYAEAFMITKNDLFKETVDEIFTYLTRDMLSQEGGFYSAEDADSEGEEGKFYVWEYSELKKIIGKDFGLFEKVFNVIPEGNYREEHTGRATGKNILHMNKTAKEIAQENNLSTDQLKKLINIWRKKLFETREKRIHPLKDTKILTDWNGLVIAGLSKASVIKNRYMEVAEKTADFVLDKMVYRDNRLLHRYAEGKAQIDGFLCDYSFFVWGLLELYTYSGKSRYILEAVKFTESMIDIFSDSKGGFFDSPENSDLIVRPKEGYDGAIPSGNSVAVYNLFRLYRITGEKKYRDLGEKTLQFFGEKIKSIPAGYSMMITAFDYFISSRKDVVVSGKEYKDLLSMINKIYDPYRSIIVKSDSSLNSIIGYLEEIPVKDEPSVYICEDFSCEFGKSDPEKIHKKLISS